MNDRLDIPPSIIEFYKAHLRMCKDLNHSRLKFTLDGRLLGDIGELLVEEFYGMLPLPKRTPGADGKCPNTGRYIQVKATQSSTKGPAFSFGKGTADHLIFLWLDFESGKAEVVYNGPEEPVRKELKEDFRTLRVKLHIMRALDEQVRDEDRLPRIR